MGYAQWIVINVINSMSSNTLSIANAIPDVDKSEGWGKFYRDGNKDEEIKASEINKITVPPGGSKSISSCGRSDSASGTTGHLDLYDGDTKICRVYWDCPWGSKANDFGISEKSTHGYWIQQGSWNRDSGAIGSVDVEVGKKG
ncbi:Aegerolysin family protein [Penicillium coprophilum]|uniref:Aegerolysin family protein n=1 Tax=Penicillium coprophilum TaxID=36646 RepID=UPI00238EFA4A|nr:Aegerolysin family protein [Penicillium coprophilum]KAJ5162791.1 Aegerolysin family protein [Penicillium coprophilum]